MSQVQKSCVFFGNAESVFVARTRDKLIEYGIDVEVVDLGRPLAYRDGRRPNAVMRILRRIHDVCRRVNDLSGSNCAVIHALTPHIVWLAPLLAARFRRVVLIAYGSDVLRRSRKLDPILKIGLHFIDEAAATNDNVREVLIGDFSAVRKKNCRILRFGLPVLEEIDGLALDRQAAKTVLGLDPEKICVALGYAATTGQRQVELIELALPVSKKLDHVQFIVPCQYGETDQMATVKAALRSQEKSQDNPEILILEEFLNAQKSAVLRLATDVLINHSVSDAFSSTVLEVLYAGNLVLAGRHLPYSSMPGFGQALRQYEHAPDLIAVLDPANLQRWRSDSSDTLKRTREQINAVASWQGLIRDWESFLFPPDACGEAVRHG